MVAQREAPQASFSGVAGSDFGSSTGVMGSIFGSAPVTQVKAAVPKKINISSGVAQGMLLQKTQPVYPPIAKAARVQGTVVLQAKISKTGSIEDLHVISGPAMLQQAALDAVKSWRYRPYLLNNEPVEVETTVNVIFTLGG
jgi:protein TonB